MANRFPLILNTSSNQLQELPSGDSLDLTGSGLNMAGGTNINTGTRGDILVYNASGNITKLNIGSSGQVLKSNGSDVTYGSIGSATGVYYVTKSGSNSADGTSIDTAFASIKHAVANIGTPTATNPAIIFVKSGTYEESQLPIVVPAHTTIAGDSLRATVVKPASGLDSGGSIQNNRSTLFKMSNATVLQDLVMDGMGGYTPGSPAHKPESATIGGVYLAFNNASPISTKSPYIYNCTSFGNGATGAVLDGSAHASGNRSMLFHTYTAVHSDGLGIFLKANANAEMISTFTYYCQVGYAAIGGSKIRSLNSSNAYGEYAVYSAGFDAGETANTGTVKGTMLVYTNVLTTSFQDGETVTGGTSGATAKVVNVQAEPKRIYIVSKSGTFQASETVTGGTSGATATLTSGTVEVNQSGRVLVSIFATIPAAGDSLQFNSTDGNAFQIQSVSTVTISGQAYRVIIFSKSRATAVAADVGLTSRKEFSLVRLTGHDFLQVGTGGTDTTNWPNNPTQSANQSYQVMTNETDPGRVYYTATDESGNFYVGSQFKVDQATGNVTLDASAFNLSGLESLRLGSVGGLIGASVNEFSTDGTLSQNSNTKVPTQNAVKTYVDGQIAGLNADKIIEGDTSVETIDSGSDGNIQFKIDAALKLKVDNDGHTIPGADSASDLGLTGTRWRNVYADTLYGAGSNITALNGSNIASGTVPVARIGTGTKSTSTFYRGDGTFATVTPPAITTINSASNNRIVTSDGGTTVTAESGLTFDGTTLDIGNGNVSIEQDSSSEVTPLTLSNGTSGASADTRLLIKAAANGGGDPYIKFDAGGTNFLIGERYAGTTNNILVMGAGETAQNISGLFVRHDGKVGINDNDPSQALEVSGNIKAYGGSAALLTEESGGGQGHVMSGGTSVYFGTTNNTEIRFRTNNTIRATLDTSGHWKPYANNSFDMGSTSLRWRNIYTMDLQLSNKGKLNDVDGTWGDYTVQEGESDLFLINNRNGKKYKFNLSEVS